MNQVELTEWKINIDNLPDKEFREKNNFIQHYLNETDNMQYAFLFYNVVEYRMGWYSCALAILTEKDNPVFLFDSKKFHFRHSFNSDFVYGDKSNIIQLVRPVKDNPYSKHTFCLLDFKKNLFSIISFDCSDFYCFKEKDVDKFSILLDKPDDFIRYQKREQKVCKDFSNLTVDCSKLSWTDVSYLDNYDEIYWNNQNQFELR